MRHRDGIPLKLLLRALRVRLTKRHEPDIGVLLKPLYAARRVHREIYVGTLADFTAQQGVRDTTDVMEKYRKGALGALPDPELINSLLSIKSGVKGDDADAK